MTYENPVIRPPSEWRSGLIRVTRGCNWNRCRFCGIYAHLGEPVFSVRPLTEIVSDILSLRSRRADIESVFLGDADPLFGGMELMLAVLKNLRNSFALSRITSYARFSTLYRLGQDNICALADAGLSRIHIGLESGDDKTLYLQRKGQNRKMVHTTAAWLKQAGIELSVYVLLGLGGKTRWHEHATETAHLLNEIAPDFIRLRRLFIYPESPHGGPPCPLTEERDNGTFVEQSPEGTILELEMLLSKLNPMASFFTCDHSNNYLAISGNLDSDKNDMLQEIHEFLALPAAQREHHYASVGSGI